MTAARGRSRRSASPLARPVWQALTNDHAALARGDALARRYPSEIGPLGGARDGSAEALAALGALVRASGPLVTLQQADEAAPPGAAIAWRREGVQMVFAADAPSRAPATVVPLTRRHAEAMLALARLTAPGPFEPRTHALGRFFGIFADTMLVAMAGQRTRFPGFVEVSAVCTHPGHRGRGHAATLIRAVAEAILAERRTPFLQSYADNAGALALYRRLGFVAHARVGLTLLEPAE